MNSQSRNISLVLLCHFISAVSTLGIAPFFSLILHQSFQQQPSMLIGFLYVLPTLLTAISAPMWGKLADRMNKKSAILRAQLGLSISFFIAAFSAQHLAVFIVSLCLQGILGGTLAAANAYLAKTVSQQKLPQILNLTQLSARCAFLVAPIVIGFLIHVHSVFSIYALLGTITFLSSILIMIYLENDEKKISMDLKKDKIVNKRLDNKKSPEISANLPYGLLLLGTFVLSFSLVATFPYFLFFLNTVFDVHNTTVAGIIFAIPHAVYLLILLPCQRLQLYLRHPLKLLMIALIVLSISFIYQAYTSSFVLLIILRVIMGISMTCAYISLNKLIAQLPFAQKEGRVFAWLDSFNKYGGVVAGVLAGVMFSAWGVSAPFMLAALPLLLLCAIYQLYLIVYSTSSSQQHKEAI